MQKETLKEFEREIDSQKKEFEEKLEVEWETHRKQ